MNDVVKHFHMMAKPIGPICNLNCTYCYYLDKEKIFPSEDNRSISDAMLDRFVRQYIAAQNVQQINFSWQGGEPTLLGLEFFEKVVRLQKIYCPPTKQIFNDLQTNGTLLDEKWCSFLRENRFLVGLSIDGPQDLHDRYRMDKGHKPTFERVVAAAHLMKKHGVEFNTLTVVNRENAKRPLDVYRFFRDELSSQYLQFIPCVEPKDFTTVAPWFWNRDNLPRLGDVTARPGAPDSIVTDWTVDPDDYGNFLCTIFDEWIRHDVGEVFVPLFDCALGRWMGMPSSACYFAEVCGKALAFEHDGSIYSCDHYVYPEYYLGNIKEKTLSELVYSQRQAEFGLAKTDTLPQYCRDCEVLFACNGECPKNRLLKTPEGQPGLNYLCSGLRKFFKHIDPWMKLMAQELRAGRTADNVMKLIDKPASSIKLQPVVKMRAKLNAHCPCGSSRKYKKCCYPKDVQRATK